MLPHNRLCLVPLQTDGNAIVFVNVAIINMITIIVIVMVIVTNASRHHLFAKLSDKTSSAWACGIAYVIADGGIFEKC